MPTWCDFGRHLHLELIQTFCGHKIPKSRHLQSPNTRRAASGPVCASQCKFGCTEFPRSRGLPRRPPFWILKNTRKFANSLGWLGLSDRWANRIRRNRILIGTGQLRKCRRGKGESRVREFLERTL